MTLVLGHMCPQKPNRQPGCQLNPGFNSDVAESWAKYFSPKRHTTTGQNRWSLMPAGVPLTFVLFLFFAHFYASNFHGSDLSQT